METIRQDIWEPLSGHIKCLYEKYYAQFYKYYDENLRLWWEKCIRKTVDFVRKVCPEDSIFYEMADALETMDVERMKAVLSHRYNEWKLRLTRFWERGKCTISTKQHLFKNNECINNYFISVFMLINYFNLIKSVSF